MQIIEKKFLFQKEEVMKSEIIEIIPNIIVAIDKTKLSTKATLGLIAIAIILIFVYILSK